MLTIFKVHMNFGWEIVTALQLSFRFPFFSETKSSVLLLRWPNALLRHLLVCGLNFSTYSTLQ